MIRFATERDIPDLVPILSVVAGSRYGAIFTDVGRLRLKESDRVESVAAMLRNLGATVDIVGDTLKIHASQKLHAVNQMQYGLKVAQKLHFYIL